eukprot:6404410-Lingulodinium_polyedra.AAC.1
MALDFGDVHAAFTQSDLLDRPQGPLYARVCPGVGPGSGALAEVVRPIYGLDDGPIRWFRSLCDCLGRGGMRRTALEPCWYVLAGPGGRPRAM